jgi:biotin transport system permease protein
VISLYRPGTSPLHRAPAGAKLAGLAVLVLVISLGARTVPAAAVALAVGPVAFACGGYGPTVWARQLWSTRWLVVILVVTQVIFLSPADAFVNTTRVVSAVVLAGLLTLTTSSGALLDALETMLGPLRRFGVDPWRVSFTLLLTIALVPVIADLAGRIRDASRARDVRLGVRGIVTLLVMSLRHADRVADAMVARGIE